MNVYFVILHYQAINETVACIRSIEEHYCNVKIVIVDNHSPNGSGEQLKAIYKEDLNVTVICAEENFGFAKGNNIGYTYAKQHGAEFIIQVNNDTIFDDKNFINTLLELYKTEHYAVLGPDIVHIKDGQHQNPLNGFEVTPHEIRWRILKNQIGAFLALFNLDRKIKCEKVYQPNWKEQLDITADKTKVLQGCCYIFSPIYIEEFDGMFSGTFMYYEEHILDYLCHKKNLKMIYSPKLSLKHLRKASTGSVVKQDKDKRRFKYKNSAKSLKAFYLNYLK